MTEAGWLNGCSYRRMYDVVRNRATTRQVRLYMVACCRLMASEFFDGRILCALEIAERCADDPQTEAVANAVWDELVTSPRPRLPEAGPEGELARGIMAVWQLLDKWWGGVCYKSARHAIAHAAYLCLRDRPREIFTGGAGNAAEYCAQAIDHAESLLLGGERKDVELDGPETETEIRRAIANLLRDIFGNPLRPITFDDSWLTPNVLSLTRQMYDSSDFSAMPILADALQDAGCTNDHVLNHCRGDGPHIRGCWVVDSVLTKE